MKVLNPGHEYVLDNKEFPDQPGQVIRFINKAPVSEGSDQLNTVHDGTTTEEVIRVVIDRLMTLQDRVPCRENALAITKLEESLMWLDKRTAERLKRAVEGTEAN